MVVQNDLPLEDRIHLQDAATTFALYVIEKYPQINKDGKLNYYIAGSLAVLLLSQANSIDLLDSSKLPDVSIKETKKLDKCLLAKLKDFIRPIQDFDYVATPVYSYEEKRLRKGGGGPSIDELPNLARDVLAEAIPGHKVMCDPVSMYNEDKVARIKIQDRDCFIADPRQIFGYKVLHLIQKFRCDPDKFKKDFTILHDALLQGYTEKELIKSAYAVLVGFEDSMAEDGPKINKYVKQLDQNPNFNSTVRTFFEKLKQYDAEYKNIM